MFLVKLIDKIISIIEKVLKKLVNFIIELVVLLIFIILFLTFLFPGLVLSIIALIITPLKPYIGGFFTDFGKIIIQRFLNLFGIDADSITKKLDDINV
jgi:hypothetical protein